MKYRMFAAGLCLLTAACGQKETLFADGAPQVRAVSEIEAGAYIADIGGCHDCHTPGWAQNGGAAPEDVLLTGVPVGFSGPWGTSYASNLRLSVEAATREGWVVAMSNRDGRPPMPWWTLHRMNPEDLGALYTYIASLGPAGEPAPAPLPPGSVPETPFIWFQPVGPEAFPAEAVAQ